MSNAALLDILSNGNDPPKIQVTDVVEKALSRVVWSKSTLKRRVVG